MKIASFIVGLIGFLLVWFVVAVVIGWVMVLLFPSASGGYAMVGFGFDWRNLPGTVLGLLAGIQSFRASVKRNR